MHAASVNPEPGSNSPKKVPRYETRPEPDPTSTCIDEVPRQDATLWVASPWAFAECRSTLQLSKFTARHTGGDACPLAGGQGSDYRCHVRPCQDRGRQGRSRVLDRFLPVAPAAGSGTGVYAPDGGGVGARARARTNQPWRSTTMRELTFLGPRRLGQIARRPAKARATVSSSAYWTLEPAGSPCARRVTVIPVEPRRSAR
jgi:hypothetical protein